MRTSLPPIDIMMVWHSFMLNPCHYSDFCKATRPDGAGVHGIPWSLVNETIADDAGACILPQSKDNHTDLLYLDASLLTIIEANGQSGIKTLQPMAAKYPHEDTGSSPLGLSVPLPLDLAAAVHRQMIFTLKMARFGWIHSPNTNSILQRAVARYRNFFSLFSIAAGDHQVVPTVDIDLVWHTHQLSPACYALFSTTATKGRFINHVDSIEEGLIRSGFERTEMLYQNIFGEEYSICSSWFCEAMRLKREGLFADDDGLMALQTLIAQFNQRSLQLGLSTVLDLAECRCYERGVSGPPRVVENKGLSCGDCATNCSGS
ncbi:hypothetical protein QBC38DRAFT_482407 [Podospora fimiseda]|uniref:Uncharacterized protein n=1 Tax=Podospora fimiseda TaxID=252190 RepID=A0AAN7BLA3_9PEZI|nr:hypothetical protein QBC38DRAFT_482407 [Podospora fimiseda]